MEVLATRVGVEVPLATNVGAIVIVVEAGGSEDVGDGAVDWAWLVCGAVGAGPGSVDGVSGGLGLGLACEEEDGDGPGSVELVGDGSWVSGGIVDVPWLCWVVG